MSINNVREIIASVTEFRQMPLQIGSRCESNVFYRIENLSSKDIENCAEHLAEKVLSVLSPQVPDILVSLHGSYTGLAQELGKKLSELVYQQLDVVNLDPKNYSKNKDKLKDKNAILVNDVITTARTCLAYHSQITVDNARVLGWVTLVDRTFGPGPVPIISAVKGEPVRIMES